MAFPLYPVEIFTKDVTTTKGDRRRTAKVDIFIGDREVEQRHRDNDTKRAYNDIQKHVLEEYVVYMLVGDPYVPEGSTVKVTYNLPSGEVRIVTGKVKNTNYEDYTGFPVCGVGGEVWFDSHNS